MDMNLSKFQEVVKDREAQRDASMGLQSQTWLSDWTTTANYVEHLFMYVLAIFPPIFLLLLEFFEGRWRHLATDEERRHGAPRVWLDSFLTAASPHTLSPNTSWQAGEEDASGI